MRVHKIDDLISKEIDLYPKKWNKNFKKILLYYPNDYFVGMSNLGFHTILKKINELPDVVCERSFYPFLYSFESKTFITNFDVVIFSISFEIDFLHVIEVLRNAKIPYFKNQRSKPLLVAGGIAITLNPFLMKDIFDVQLIGEGEELIVEFLNAYFNSGKFENINGVFIEEKTINRRIYNGNYVAHNTIITPFTEFPNTLLIEIERGCPYSCYFCASTYNYRPYRERDKNLICELVNIYKDKINKVGLIGSSVLSHKNFLEIGEYILSLGLNFSVSSMRLNKITDENVKLLKKANNKTFTVAIEAGNEKLRKKINKKLSDDEIFTAIEIFIRYKILNLKFYFMIGFPEEEIEDVKSIVNMVKKIKFLYLKNKKYLKRFGKFTLSVNPFIPKRNTPFFKYKIEDLNILKNKIKYLQEEIKKIPNVEIIFENIYNSYLQYILSTGDSSIIKFLIECSEKKFNTKKIVESFVDKIK